MSTENETLFAEPLPSELRPIITNIAEKENFITYDIESKKKPLNGASYMGVIFEVDIKGKTKHDDKEINLFVKKSIIGGPIDDVVSVSDMYLKEAFVYSDLAKVFKKLQDEANIPEKEQYKMVKCYHSSVTAIVLDNIVKKDFKTCNRMNVVEIEFAESCVKELAKFHALSIVLKKKRPVYFQEKIKHLENPWVEIMDKSKETVEYLVNITVNNLDSDVKKIAEKYKAVFFEQFLTYLSAEDSTVACLCHGDYKTDNILMYETENKIAEVIPVDFQCMYHGCPINDFMTFVIGSSDRKFRELHLENLKQLYYDTLVKFLKYFNIESSEVFSKKEIENMFEKRKEFYILIALLSFPFLFPSDDKALDLKNDIVSHGAIDLNQNIVKRFTEILEDFGEC